MSCRFFLCLIGVIEIRTSKPLKPCHAHSCPKLTRRKYCEDHEHLEGREKAKRDKLYDRHARDKKTAKFYSSARWQKVRDMAMIRDNGLCQQCLAQSKITLATMVHHIVPVKRDWSKRLELDNLTCLCDSCHEKILH